jgi:hypothetical protein
MLGLALRQKAAYRKQRLACHRSYDAAHKAERVHTMFVAIDGFARALQSTCELGHGCGVSFDLYSGRRTQVISGANQNERFALSTI